MRIYVIAAVLFMTLPIYAQEQSPSEPFGQVVLPVILPEDLPAVDFWQPGEELWLQIEYSYGSKADPVFIEPAEKIIWLKDRPALFLGGTGAEVPQFLQNRGIVFVRIFEGTELIHELSIYPRQSRVRLQGDSQQMKMALHKMLPGVDSTYLAQVANFLAGNLANLDVTGTSYSISGYGPVINNTGEWVGVPVTGNQNLFATVNGDTGATTADTTSDDITIIGGGIATTAIAGDTLTITAIEADGDDTNELQNVFQTLSGNSGQTTADSQTDSLAVVGTGTVSTAVSGDTLTISGSGLTEEVDGDPANELQNLFSNMTADAGNTTADQHEDTLNIVGSGIVNTSLIGDTLTINATEADGDDTNELQNVYHTVSGNSGVTTANSQTDSLAIVGIGTVNTSVSGDTLTISGSGLTEEVDGDPANELQNLFSNMIADAGNTTADQHEDTLNIVGSGIVNTSVVGDTLTINATEADGDDTNELQNVYQTVSGNSGVTTANSQTDSLAIVGIGTVSTSVSGDTVLISGSGLIAEVDGDPSNELQNLFQTIAGNSGNTTANAQNDTLNVVGAGTVSTSVSGDTLTIAGSGLTAEVDGDPTNELQNIFQTVSGDSGSTSANIQSDTLQVVGSGLVSTSVSGDTLTVNGAISDDSLNFTQLSDALVVDATTTVNLDANAADLNFDNNTLVIDASTNSLGVGTAVPLEKVHIDKGNLLQTPGNPTLVGQVGIGFSEALFVSGRYVYVADPTDDDLKIIDVSVPTNPTIISTLTIGSGPEAIYVSGNYAYIVDRLSDDLKIIDVSNPTTPVQVGSLAVGSNPTSIAISGRYAYVTDTGTDDLKVIDVGDPNNPTLIGSLVVGSLQSQAAFQGQYVYVMDSTADLLRVIDVKIPSNPVLVGSGSIANFSLAVAVSGRYAYVTDLNTNTVRVLDVSDPTSLTTVGTVSFGSRLQSIFVSGNYAFVGNVIHDHDLVIVDLSDPTAPKRLGAVEIGGGPEKVFVAGRYAYGVDFSNLYVVDISGADVTAMTAHSMETGHLQVRNDLITQGELQVRGGARIGTGGLVSEGAVAINGDLDVFNDVTVESKMHFTGQDAVINAFPANSASLFSSLTSGTYELKARDSAGNITTLSPHNFSLIGDPSEPLAWSYYSERDGQAINVDMLKAIRQIEKLSGEQLVHIKGAGNQNVNQDQSLTNRLAKFEAQNAVLKRENLQLRKDMKRIKAVLGILD